MKLVEVTVDETLPAGKVRVGGVKVRDVRTAEEFRLELDTVLVACASEEAAAAFRERVRADPAMVLRVPEKSTAPREADCRYGCCKAGDVFVASELVRAA